MAQILAPGQIIILNGVPRSGKSSIVAVIQDTFDGVWMSMWADSLRHNLFAVKGQEVNKRERR